MQTSTRRTQAPQFLITMLLGVVMAAVIWLVAGPEQSWIGFLLAAIYGQTGEGASCAARIAGASRR